MNFQKTFKAVGYILLILFLAGLAAYSIGQAYAQPALRQRSAVQGNTAYAETGETLNSPSAVALFVNVLETVETEGFTPPYPLDTSSRNAFTNADLHDCGAAMDWVANEGIALYAGSDLVRLQQLERQGDALAFVCGGM